MIWPRVINLVPEGWLKSDWHARLINETGPCARNVCGKESAKVIFFVFFVKLIWSWKYCFTIKGSAIS